MKSRPQRVLSSWLAILAIVLNALMPTFSLALESGSGTSAAGTDGWIEVCSTQGSTWVRLAPDGRLLDQTSHKPADAPFSIHSGHCLYCVTHAASFGLPPQPALAIAAWQLDFTLFSGRELPAYKAVAWLAPTARAPPVPIS
jgi:hypothetical protein